MLEGVGENRFSMWMCMCHVITWKCLNSEFTLLHLLCSLDGRGFMAKSFLCRFGHIIPFLAKNFVYCNYTLPDPGVANVGKDDFSAKNWIFWIDLDISCSFRKTMN